MCFMKNVEYFCMGFVEECEYGYYVLSVFLYMYFMFFIRRYLDIVVYRFLVVSFGID